MNDKPFEANLLWRLGEDERGKKPGKPHQESPAPDHKPELEPNFPPDFEPDPEVFPTPPEIEPEPRPDIKPNAPEINW